MDMKMTSTAVCKNSWADVVKGMEGPTKQKKKFSAKAAEFVPRKKVASTAVAEPQCNLNPEAPEFYVPELTMNPLAVEFVPPATQGLNPTTKEFFPTEHKLLNKAAEMQKLLLECYTDDEDSSDDEPQRPVVTQKRNQVMDSAIVRPFRPPPGLAPPKLNAELNAFAKAFDPAACLAPGKIGKPAPTLTSAINFAGFCSEDEDEEVVSKPWEFSKMEEASLHDSTSAGESSDSETESWSGPHSP